MKRWIKTTIATLALLAMFAAVEAQAFNFRGTGSGFGRNQVKEFFLSVSGNQVFGSGQTRSGHSFLLSGSHRRGSVRGIIEVEGVEVGSFEGIARSNGLLARYKLRGRGASSGNLLGRPYSGSQSTF